VQLPELGRVAQTRRIGSEQNARGAEFRTGLVKGLERTDLVVWLALATSEPVALVVTPASG